MTCHVSTTATLLFDAAIAAPTQALQRHGFGVLTEIDVRATLKKKLNVDFRPCRIPAACDPQMAYRTLQAEDRIGTRLLRNVILQQHGDSAVEVSAVDPIAPMQAIDNQALADTAEKVGAC